MLALDEEAFDQGTQGWRLLERQGCYSAAADLIAAYRAKRHPKRDTTSWFHEAQMRAYAGDYARAVAILPNARHRYDGFGWNAYLDATAAFLRRDRAALDAARERLAATPLPHTHQWLFDDAGRPIAVPAPGPGERWPPNLAVVDALQRCFARSYRQAYSAATCYIARGAPTPVLPEPPRRGP